VSAHGVLRLGDCGSRGAGGNGLSRGGRMAGQVQTDAISVDEVWPWGKRIERTGETEGVGN